ncbi:MAG: hypothetical protein WCC57_20105 [Paracoccaceae bacterium]
MGLMSGLGHNGGPSVEAGVAWRTHCWTKARADLLPHLPIEVLRGRVKRARELGLEYRTYASVRAATGHDVIGFLFSTNALRLLVPLAVMPVDRAEKLAAIVDCGRVALVQAPLTIAQVQGMAAIDEAQVAPLPLASWAVVRDSLRAALGKRPGDGMLLVGDTALEREWCAAGRLAGYLPAERYFVRQ